MHAPAVNYHCGGMRFGAVYLAPLCKGSQGLFLYYALSFLPCSNLSTGDPFGTSCHCLAAARSRRGSDMPPACHSLPRRRFATLEGAALRGKGFVSAPRQWCRTILAPLIGELAAVRTTDGSPVLDCCQSPKERSAYRPRFLSPSAPVMLVTPPYIFFALIG